MHSVLNSSHVLDGTLNARGRTTNQFGVILLERFFRDALMSGIDRLKANIKINAEHLCCYLGKLGDKNNRKWMESRNRPVKERHWTQNIWRCARRRRIVANRAAECRKHCGQRCTAPWQRSSKAVDYFQTSVGKALLKKKTMKGL